MTTNSPPVSLLVWQSAMFIRRPTIPRRLKLIRKEYPRVESFLTKFSTIKRISNRGLIPSEPVLEPLEFFAYDWTVAIFCPIRSR